MSYEGYEEYICASGHKTRNHDIFNYDYSEEGPVILGPKTCSICGSSFKYYADVDATNGYEEDNPMTYPAPVEEIGYTDEWKEDHYGTKYAVKHICYKPASNSRWREVIQCST